ncbi:MAG TPA: MinD/ParA family protein [Clostridia bacterium]|nr:MinD/ParA family protein [Clostridia bacterium]
MKDQAARLRELVHDSVKKQSPPPVKQTAGTRIIAVASGKGGVGKSNLVVNLSIALAQRGKKVVIFDADLGLANLDILMGLVPRYTLYDVLYGRKELRDVIIDGPAGVQVIPGGSGIQELANVKPQDQQRLLDALQEVAAAADYVFIDTGAGISRVVVGFLAAAQEVIIVTTTEPTSLTDAYGVIKILAKYGEHAEIKTVINRVNSLQEGENAGRRLKMTALRFLNLELESLGCIREDKMLIKAVKEQQPVLLKYPFSHAAEDIQVIAGNLSNTVVPRPFGVQKFLNRLHRLFC